MTALKKLVLPGLGAPLDPEEAVKIAGPYPPRQTREFKSAHETRVDDKANVQEAIKGLNDNIEAINRQIGDFVKKANEEIAATKSVSAETKTAVEGLVKTATELQARLEDAEKKLARLKNAGNDNEPRLSMGQRFTASEAFKSAVVGGRMAEKSRSGLVEVKAITSVTTDTDGAVGDYIRPDRLPGVIVPPLRRLRMRDILMAGRTNSNAIEFVRETLFTNNAAAVAEGALKPESTLRMDLASTPVRTLAHFVVASVQVLEDIPMLESYIDGRLRYGLDYAEDAQLLSGNGTGANILGLAPQATAFDELLRPGTAATFIDSLRLAILQVTLSGYDPNAIVLHPTDWATIELTKDTAGNYIFTNPVQMTQPRLWGRPVVEMLAQTVGRALVGAFDVAAQIFDRTGTAVELSTEDVDNFRKNMVTIRAEKRLALAVFRPTSFVDQPLADAA